MATGDQTDFLGRITAALPGGWFPSFAPVLTALLSAPAWMMAWLYGVLQYVRLQQRIATATDVNLDMIGADYLGASVQRAAGQTDATFRARITGAILAPKATRAALVGTITALTGTTPTVFEPANPADAGGWGGTGATITGLGYGAAGGWGDLQLPAQFFLLVPRPSGGGIAKVAGWGDIGSGQTAMPGGYGAGVIEYAALAMVEGQIGDAEIYATIAATIPAGVTAWTKLA